MTLIKKGEWDRRPRIVIFTGMFELRITVVIFLCAGVLRAQLPATHSLKKTAGSSAVKTGNLTNFKDYVKSVTDKNGAIHSIWTEFQTYGSPEVKDSSFIMYSRLDNSNLAWSKPKRLDMYRAGCLDDNNTVVSGGPCIGPNGELYLAWGSPGGLYFQRSFDGGKTWLPEEKLVAKASKNWHVTLLDSCYFKGAPQVACIESGEYKGRVYIVWSDGRNGIRNEDVFMTYSDDKGDTWTEAIILTYRPNHREQFKPLFNIDPATNNMYVLYYDQQNFPFGGFTDLYLAVSKNAGNKFEHYRVNAQPIPLTSRSVISSYLSVNGKRSSSDKSPLSPLDTIETHGKSKSQQLGVIIGWQYVTDDNLNTFTVLLSDSMLNAYDQTFSVGELQIARSFSYSENMEIRFYSPKEAVLSAILTKPLEHEWEKVIEKDKRIKKGYNTIKIKAAAQNLPKGNYVLTLYYNHRNTYVWITEE